MRSGPENHGPTRIELASSELEGGSTMAWVDPQQVLACVAQVDSRESFSRFLEPRLADIDSPASGPADDGTKALPARVSCLLERLRQTHARLFRENTAAPGSQRVIRPVLASVEEGAVYFLKAAPCWVFRVRNGTSELIRSGGDLSEGGAADAGFGQSARLHLAVSSVEVLPHDIVVLLVSSGGTSPDRLAVAGVFKANQDLKRACDGLVNLFSLASAGVGAVAMRFVPVGVRSGDAVRGIDLVGDLERELFDGITTSSAAARPEDPMRSAQAAPDSGGLGLEEFVLPAFLEEAGNPFVSHPPEAPGAACPSRSAAPAWAERKSAEAADRGPLAAGPSDSGSVEGPARVEPFEAQPLAEEPEFAPSVAARFETGSDQLLNQPSADRVERSLGGMPPRGKRVLTPWAAAFATVLATLLAVVGVPRGIQLLRGGAELAEGGVIRVDPVPPARAIFIDGVDQETGSPAILEGVAPGVRRVLLDLGAFGSMEVKVRVRTGETVDLHPRATGSLEISAIDARPRASVWLSGRQRMSLPCRVDSLPAGWQEVLYEDDRLPLWQRQVLVLAGETARLRINNAFATDQALLRVESWSYRQGEGLHAADGDTVFVDRRYFGVTPIEREVPPGLHGVCVVGREGSSWTEVLNLTAGSSRVVAPRFGLEPWPRIDHQEPGRILLRGAVPLTATFTSPDGAPPRNPRLHFPGLDATVRDLPLSPVDPEKGIYVGIVDPRWIPMNQAVEYYFTVQTTEGQTLCSELYRLTAVGEISQGILP